MQCGKLLAVLSFLMNCVIFAQENNTYPLASHCPQNYEQARQSFIEAASQNGQVTQQTSLRLMAKGPHQSHLSIDIAVLGDLKKAKKILFHISGTHGVECGAGSAIQHEFLSNSPVLQEDIAIIFVHALNPFGMAWNRRVNEKNIDLNRNCVDQRETPLFYGVIDPIINPKTPIPWDIAFQELCSQYEWATIKKIIMEGQYHYSEGLFYGGEEIAEGPKLVLEWCQTQFAKLNCSVKELCFGIIDVHSGLGPYAVDTLLTIAPPTESMINFFGDKMAIATQITTTGYKANGVFAKELANCIQNSTRCEPSQIFVIGEEFGTIQESDVLSALYNENIIFQYAQRNGALYDLDSEEGKILLKAFYPEEKEWRHRVVFSGRELLLQSLHFLNLPLL
jgi:hypothetical protein